MNAQRTHEAEKETVLESLEPGQPVTAPSWRALRDRLGLDMSITAFKRAINSMHYNGMATGHPRLVLSRPIDHWAEYGGRPVSVVRLRTRS